MKLLSLFLVITLQVSAVLPATYNSQEHTRKQAFAGVNANDRVWIYYASGDAVDGNLHASKINTATKKLSTIVTENPAAQWIFCPHPFCKNRYLLLIHTNNPDDIGKLDLNAIMAERK